VKILILTEGSSHIGHGHITRCLSLYEAFSVYGQKPFMLVAGDGSVEGVLRGVNHRIFDWHGRWKEVRDILKDYHLVVVDSYIAGREIYEDISGSARLGLFIDDYKRLDYPPGVVLNGGVYAEELCYPERTGVRYLLGPKYIPLRSAFWKIGKKAIRKRLRRVLITFGGDDTRNMTPRVVNLLLETRKDLELFVVVGKGFGNKDGIYRFRHEGVKIFEGLSAEGMRDIMLSVDVAISAGGQTTYELARTGTPTILVAVAENQLLNCKGWEKQGSALYAGWWEEKVLMENLLSALNRLADWNLRKEMSRRGRRLVDGRGALRVARELLRTYDYKHGASRASKELYHKNLPRHSISPERKPGLA
jgi:spore coat polysaccharide biosynthesis predicted glycosyltransferase SpsG